MRFFNSLKAILLRLFRVKNEVTGVVCLQDHVKVFFSRGRTIEVAWSAISQIIILQNDMLTWEEISLYVTYGVGAEFRLDELMSEFETFCIAADDAFPGFAKVIETYRRDAIGRWSDIAPIRLDLKFGHPVTLSIT